MKFIEHILALMLCLGLQTTAWAQNPAHIKAIERLSQRMGEMQTLISDFDQKTFNDSGQLQFQSQGQLKIAKPNQLLWKTTGDHAQEIISNGETLWIHDPDLEQVIIHHAKDKIQDSPVRLLSHSTDELLAKFQVAYSKDQGIERFLLTPQEASDAFETIQMSFFDQTLVGLKFDDALGQTTEIQLKSPTINQTIQAAVFEFQIPEGIDIIDERKP